MLFAIGARDRNFSVTMPQGEGGRQAPIVGAAFSLSGGFPGVQKNENISIHYFSAS